MHVFHALPVDEGVSRLTVHLQLSFPITVDIYFSSEDVIVERCHCILIFQGLRLLYGRDSLIVNRFIDIVASGIEVSTTVHHKSFHGVLVFFRRVLRGGAEI